MITFKKYKDLLEEVLDPTGKPISSMSIGKIRKPEESGFCEHNPEVRKFAQRNPVQMFIVLSFVFFTMQKEWYAVVNYFESFIKWLFEKAIPKDDWSYANEPFTRFPNLLGAGKKEEIKEIKKKTGDTQYSVGKEIIKPEELKFVRLYGEGEARYIAKIWKNKERIYDYIMSNLEYPEKIFIFLTEEIQGLGGVKAAFCTQLILGKFGCIDSINQRVYSNLIKTKYSNVFTPEGSVKPSVKAKEGYLGFLKDLEDMFQQDISQTLWDDWCEIVDLKILNANESGENKKVTINLKNGETVEISPYKIKRGEKTDTSEGMKQMQREIESEPVLGKKTSEQHMSAITNPELKKYYESIRLKFYDVIKEYIENTRFNY